MYNSIISMPWYKLPVEEQKEFAFLMCRQQRPMMLTAYGFLTMNFESYMSVMFYIVLILQMDEYSSCYFAGIEGSVSIFCDDHAVR